MQNVLPVSFHLKSKRYYRTNKICFGTTSTASRVHMCIYLGEQSYL